MAQTSIVDLLENDLAYFDLHLIASRIDRNK
jgi:hypothetical protein